MNPNKRHNRRVRTMTAIMVTAALISGMALDSDSWVPTVTLLIASLYLIVFMIANSER